MDVLQDRLLRARATGATFASSAVDPPWGLRLPAGTQLAVHAMIQGDGWLWLDDPSDAIPLHAGDIALVRGGRVHHLADTVHTPCVDLSEFTADPGGASTRSPAPSHLFLCGAYRFAGDVGQSLLDALPAVLHLRPDPGDRLRATTQMLHSELADPLPGQQTVLDRLLDVLLVQLLRHHLDSASTQPPPWYAAAVHPVLRAPLQAVHEHPGHVWTVPELAALGGVSRATFARVFRQVLGRTPMSYLTDWRMTLARDDLRTGTDTLDALAHRYGYGSAYSFSAAFSRYHDQSPGRWRRHASATPDLATLTTA